MIKERMSLMETVAAMEKQQLVLPLFQRPFVWSEEQVCDLFDSLWQGYPIGNLLLLEQAPQDLQNRLQCCFFHSCTGEQYQKETLQQRRSESYIFEQLPTASHVVLDGQQRLFAFFIGINGAYQRAESAMQGEPERCSLYFDLYPLIELFFSSKENMESLRSEHHQFHFFSSNQLESYRQQIAENNTGICPHSLNLAESRHLQLAISEVGQWGRDRRTAKSEIRHYLKPISGLPKPLLEELEDMLDNLHHHLWVREPINNTTVAPSNSYDLLEIFSRLNQGSSFRPSDLHYAIRIIFPQDSKIQHNNSHIFSRCLEQATETEFQTNISEPQLTQFTSEAKLGTSQKPDLERSLESQHYSSEELAELSAQEWSGEIFHGLNPLSPKEGQSQVSAMLHEQQSSVSPESLEESYEQLLQIVDELKLSLDFLYHCYLFCEAEEPEEIALNIRKREGALALRNNAEHLLRFTQSLDMLRDAIDSCNFVVKHWFADRLHHDYILLPVLYFFYKQANECLDPLTDLRNVDLSRIVRWIALNEISPSVFRGGMHQLGKLWPVLHHSMQSSQSDEYFPIERLQQNLQLAFAGERSLILGDGEIESLLKNAKITHRVMTPLIALLYSHPQRISLMQRYEEREIDYIQPQKLLSKRMLKSYGLTEEQVELFFRQRNSILNLQWLPKRLQTEKGDIPFRQWLSNSQQLQLLAKQNQFQKRDLIINFMRFHHIKTEDGIYALNAFEHFLIERCNLLQHSLKQYGQNFGDWDIQAKLTKLPFPAF